MRLSIVLIFLGAKTRTTWSVSGGKYSHGARMRDLALTDTASARSHADDTSS